jgi:hypothetical protein
LPGSVWPILIFGQAFSSLSHSSGPAIQNQQGPEFFPFPLFPVFPSSLFPFFPSSLFPLFPFFPFFFPSSLLPFFPFSLFPFFPFSRVAFTLVPLFPLSLSPSYLKTKKKLQMYICAI